MRFSLITVTQGNRPDELERLRVSLTAQRAADFEWIVVDHREHPEFGGRLSAARNFGLARATGDVVAFPDDDAWYGPDVLSDVAEALSDPSVDGVSFKAVDGGGNCSAGGYMSGAKMPMDRKNVWRTAVSCSFFVRRSAVGEVVFDERLGAGVPTRFGSGEDTDFVLCLLERGARLVYDGGKSVFHPRLTRGYSAARGWRYGNGCGCVLRLHGYSVFRLLWMVGLQGVRLLQSLLTLRPAKALFHLAMACGRVCGFCRPVSGARRNGSVARNA